MLALRYAPRTRGSVRRAAAILSVVGAAMALQMVAMSQVVAAAEEICETSTTTVVTTIPIQGPNAAVEDAPADGVDDEVVTYTVPLVSCTETDTETSTQTLLETSTETVTDTSTETTTVPTTSVMPVPTTVEVPTTVSIPIQDTTTITEQGDIGATTVTEQATATETSTVNVTWGYASTINPASGQIPAVSLSASEVGPGDTLNVTVTGFSPNEVVNVELHSTPVVLAAVTVGSDGSAQAAVTIPPDTQIGQHVIRVVGLTCGIDASIPLTVVAGQPTNASIGDHTGTAGNHTGTAGDQTGTAVLDGTQTLSYTGVNTQLSIGIAAALITAGTAIVLLTRRTRQQRLGIPGRTPQHRTPAPKHRASRNELLPVIHPEPAAEADPSCV